MGYLTRFSLDLERCFTRQKVDGVDADGNPASVYVEKYLEPEDLRKEIADHAGYQYLFDDDVKWYDHEEHMRHFSKKYPGVLMTLEGEGEESGDIWKKYFRDGMMQVAKANITFEEFDPEKLS